MQALAVAIAEAGAVGQRIRTLALDPPDGADDSWALEQLRILLEGVGVVGAAAAPPPTPRLCVVDLRWEVTYDGSALTLTSTQFRLMRVLVAADGATVLVHDLAAAVFGSSYHDRDRIAAHVKRLRRRLLEQGVEDYQLEAVRGVGYRLVADTHGGKVSPAPVAALQA
jgi:DNA-binding winged helix-turn-helix (wHTH) protein